MSTNQICWFHYRDANPVTEVNSVIVTTTAILPIRAIICYILAIVAPAVHRIKYRRRMLLLEASGKTRRTSYTEPLRFERLWLYIILRLSSVCRMSCNTSVIRVQLSSVGQSPRVPVHLMPCEIEHNGPAQVSEYITATTKQDKEGEQSKL